MTEKWWEAAPIASPMDIALAEEGVSGARADFVRSIYSQESGGGRNTKTSNAGAVGGMQILPGTFREVADKGWDIANENHNLRAGIRYALKGLAAAAGDPALGAAHYYGGPGGLEKARRGVAVSDPRNPNAPTTLQYGQQVAARLKRNPIAQGVESMVNAIVPAANAAEPQEKWWEAAPLATEEEIAAAQRPPPSPAPAAPARSAGEQIAHGLGVGARGLVRGLVEIPGMVTDAITGPINAGLDAVAGEGNGFRFQRAGAAADNLMTAAGMAQAQTRGERIAEEVSRGAAGGAGFAGAGRFVAALASGPLSRALGSALGGGLGMQTASGAAGAGAGAYVKEEGGGAGLQTAAALAAAMAPGGGQALAQMGVRRALVGNEASRQSAALRYASFQDAGIDPTLAQVTRGRVAQAAESMLAKVPGGAGVMAKVGERQAEQMAQSVRDLADGLAPGADAMQAGEAIQKGIQGFKVGMQQVQARLYSKLDEYIPSKAPIQVTRTQQALKELNADIDGAPALSQMFKNGRIQGIDAAMARDIEASEIPGALPYEAIKKLRTLVGRELADNSLMSDVPRSKWSALYGALSEDLGDAARAAGPEAAERWQWANTYTRTQLARLDELSGIVGRDAPEKIFTAATTNMANGNTVIERVFGAIPQQNRKQVAAALLQRMGRATNSHQNAAADAFSSETFLTNLSAMSPAARKTIFGRLGDPGIEQRLDELAKIAQIRREDGRVFSNPSGTAGAAANIAASGGAGAGLVGWLLTGNPGPFAGALAGLAGANLTARYATSSRTAAKVVQPSQPRPGALPATALAAARAAQPTPTPEEDDGSWWRNAPLADAPVELPPMTGPDASVPPAPAATAEVSPDTPRVEVRGVGQLPDGTPMAEPQGEPVPAAQAPAPAAPIARVRVPRQIYDGIQHAQAAQGLPNLDYLDPEEGEPMPATAQAPAEAAQITQPIEPAAVAAPAPVAAVEAQRAGQPFSAALAAAEDPTPSASAAAAPAPAAEPEIIRNKQGKPFTVRMAADRAAREAGEGARVEKVDGGFVVVKGAGAPAAAPAAASEMAESEIQPGDVLNRSGEPFRSLFAAKRAASDSEAVVVPVAVEGGFVLRAAGQA